MLLIGSVAAQMIGVLPPWREGRTHDIDFVGSPADLDVLLTKLKETDLAAMAHLRKRGKYIIISEGNPPIEFNPAQTEPYLFMQRMSDNVDGQIFGLPVKVISVTTQYVIKKSYERFDVNREKNDKDIAHWQRLIKLPLTKEHAELLRLLWADMDRKFSHRKVKQ